MVGNLTLFFAKEINEAIIRMRRFAARPAYGVKICVHA